MPSDQMGTIAHVDHRKPFVTKVLHESQDGRWAHVEVYQVSDGRTLNVTPSIARHLISLGATGQVAGNFNEPSGLRLVVGMNRASPAMLISALTTHLSRCANAMNQTFIGVIRDDSVIAGGAWLIAGGAWSSGQQQRLDQATRSPESRRAHVVMPQYEPVDHRLPFVYRVADEPVGGSVAYVQVFQDRRDRRVDVTHALADHLMALDAVGQFTGNFMKQGDVRLIAVATPGAHEDNTQRFEASLRSTIGRCANAMGARLQPLSRDDHAQEGPVPAALLDEQDVLLAEINTAPGRPSGPRVRG